MTLSPASRAGLSTLQQPTLPRYFATVATGYTLVAIYGSLVPFEFTWPEDPLGIVRQSLAALGARATASPFDAAANVALFFPLGVLWSAAALFDGSHAARVAKTVAIVGLAALLSAAIECVQLGLPSRTFSPLDVVAETAGAALGCGSWWLVGQRLSVWLADFQATDVRTRRLNWALQVYLAAVSLWWLLPLDLTCRPGELSAKLRGNTLLKPFGDVTLERGLQAALVGLLFLPVGVLFATTVMGRARRARSEAESWSFVAGLTGLLAAGQFLVLGRTTDILQIAALGLGLSAGIWLASFRLVGAGAFPALRRLYNPSGLGAADADTSSGRKALLACYYLSVAASIGFVLWAATTVSPGETWFFGRQVPQVPPWHAFAVWAGGMSLLLLAPRFGVIAPIVFLVLAYGSFAPSGYFRAIGAQLLVCLLGLFGAWLNASGARGSLSRGSIACWPATGYFLWAVASAAYLYLDRRPWSAAVLVQLFRLIECATVVWMAAWAVSTQRSHWWLAVAITVCIVSGGILYPEQMYLNHHAAILVGMALPIAMYALGASPAVAVQILLMLVLVQMVKMLDAGQSRSAMAGTAAGLLVYGSLSRYRWWLLAALPLLALGVWQLTKSSFVVERFGDLLRQEQGWDTGRLAIWQYSWNAFRAFPVFGIGPGASAHAEADAHNSYLAALSETGAPGLFLYGSFWLASIFLLARTIWTRADHWTGSLSKATLAATIAYLVAGGGYALHAMQLAFLLAGWGVAVSRMSSNTNA